MQGDAEEGPFQAAGSHDALLQEGRGEGAFAKGGESADRVVPEDVNGFGEIDDPCCCLEG
jgi:hypothetical protein